MKNIKSKSAFTIVETLVAVAILMIAVAGPLVVASKGLTSALVAKDQMVASYLAQDTMETIKNTRDNNLGATTVRGWLDPFGINGATCSTENQSCDVDGIDNDFLINASTYPLYYNTATGYTHSSGGSVTPTIFSRHFYFEDVSGSLPAQVLAHVIVDWKEGTVPYQIHLISQMVTTTR